MRVRMRGFGCWAVAAAFAATAVVGESDGAPSSNDRTLVFAGGSAAFKMVDSAPRGESVGDEFIFGKPLSAAGKKVGRSQFVCVETDAGRHVQQCAGTLRLADGQLAAAGAVVGDTRRATFAVTGGTGAYEGVRGSLTSVMGRGDKSTISVHLIGG